jgi:hypothetical protein
MNVTLHRNARENVVVYTHLNDHLKISNDKERAYNSTPKIEKQKHLEYDHKVRLE